MYLAQHHQQPGAHRALDRQPGGQRPHGALGVGGVLAGAAQDFNDGASDNPIRIGGIEVRNATVITSSTSGSAGGLLGNFEFGSPDSVIAKLRQYEELGVDSFIYYASMGLNRDVQKRSMQLFIDKVLPEFS